MPCRKRDALIAWGVGGGGTGGRRDRLGEPALSRRGPGTSTKVGPLHWEAFLIASHRPHGWIATRYQSNPPLPLPVLQEGNNKREGGGL